jgi:hypothetical protein
LQILLMGQILIGCEQRIKSGVFSSFQQVAVAQSVPACALASLTV